MQYVVVIEQANHSFGAYVPDLPGYVAVAETRNEILALIHEAIELHVAQLQSDGEPVPKPTTTSELVDV